MLGCAVRGIPPHQRWTATRPRECKIWLVHGWIEARRCYGSVAVEFVRTTPAATVSPASGMRLTNPHAHSGVVAKNEAASSITVLNGTHIDPRCIWNLVSVELVILKKDKITCPEASCSSPRSISPAVATELYLTNRY